MASSDESEVSDYQAPIICGDCQGHKDVNSYCLACLVNLCDRCKVKPLHKKHQVRPRTHPDAVRARKTVKDLCRYHPHNEYVTFCTDCKVPCCPACISTNLHKNHTFTSIECAAEQARVGIEAYLQTLETSTLPESEKIYAATIERISEHTEDEEKIRQESKLIFQSLRDQIDKAEEEWRDDRRFKVGSYVRSG